MVLNRLELGEFSEDGSVVRLLKVIFESRDDVVDAFLVKRPTEFRVGIGLVVGPLPLVWSASITDILSAVMLVSYLIQMLCIG